MVVPSLNCPKRLGAGRATVNLKSFNLEILSVEAYLALLGHTRMHSPQSMHLFSKMYALPFLTLIASVGHPFMQFVQPLHFFTSRVTEWYNCSKYLHQLSLMLKVYNHSYFCAFSDDRIYFKNIGKFLHVWQSHTGTKTQFSYSVRSC